MGTAANIPTPVSLANSANVTYNQQTSATLSQVISGAGSLTMAGTAMLTLSGSNTYTGPTTISAGTLQVGNGSSGSINGTSGVADNGTLAFDLASGTTTFAQSISGTGSLRQAASNVLCLTGNNTYSGSTTITSGGTLQIGSGGGAGSIVNTIAIADGGLLAFDLSSGTTLTFALISGNGGVTQMGPSVVVLIGNNTYTGSTTIAGGGTLQIGDGEAGGSINGTSGVADNGLLAFDLHASATLSKTVSGSGGLMQMWLKDVLRLGVANSYSGPTTISSGTLQLGTSAALGTSSPVSIAAGAVLDIDAVSPTLGVLTGSGTVTNSGTSAATLTLKPAAGSKRTPSAASSRTARAQWA